MAVSTNFKKGIHFPVWQWLPMYPTGNFQPGNSFAYDGSRYIYAVIQSGTATAGSASTTQLWRFCTWTLDWLFLASTTSGNQGIDVEYDPVRNIVILQHGVGLTSWQVFNLAYTTQTIAGVSCAAWALTTMTPVLSTVANTGGSIVQPDDTSLAIQTHVITGSVSTTTVLNDTTSSMQMWQGYVGMQVRFDAATTTVGLRGQKRIILSVQSNTQMTVASALSNTPVAGDIFYVEVVGDTSPGGGTTTTFIVPTTLVLLTNKYSGHDVVVDSGTGSGQRRRIASNTSTTLTLTGAVTGNSRTGAWSPTPDATSVFRIIPSSDFIFAAAGGASTALAKLDLVANPASTWVAQTAITATVSGGSNVMHPSKEGPYYLLITRGSGTNTVYLYDIGLNSYQTLSSFWGSETITTGAVVCKLLNKRRIFIQKEGSQRCYAYNVCTGELESFGWMPYAAPSSNDGHRAVHVVTPDAADWLYVGRGGGQEMFRVPIELY